MKYPTEKMEMELCKHPQIVSKYSRAGIYSIAIDNRLVYIGQSKRLIRRLAEHKYNIEYAKKVEKKYQVMREALITGHTVSFDVICYCNEEELKEKEAEFIAKYNPILNTVIPGKGVKAETRNITLEDVLALEAGNLPPCAYHGEGSPWSARVFDEVSSLAAATREEAIPAPTLEQFIKKFYSGRVSQEVMTSV